MYVCCSKGSRILNVNALFSVIALVYKEKLFPFFILWRCLFSILQFSGIFFSFFSTPSNILYISIYIRFQFHFIRSPILMDSLRWWIYEIRLINIPFATSTQPDGSFSPILLGIFVFGKKEENIKREKYWCWVLFSCFLFVMCVPKTKYLYPKIFCV